MTVTVTTGTVTTVTWQTITSYAVTVATVTVTFVKVSTIYCRSRFSLLFSIAKNLCFYRIDGLTIILPLDG